MTITTSPSRNEYTSSASQTVFNYTFKIYVSTDLNVYVTPAGQVANDATDITTAYTVDPTTIGDDAGGFITFTSPQALNSLVTIVSGIPTDRTVDYQANGDFIPNTVNNDIDRTVSLVKQNENLASRTVQFQESQQSATGITLPAPSAGDILIWNPAGTGFDNDDGTGVAGIAAAVAATAADVVTTNADVVITNADAVTTQADAALTTTLSDEFNDKYYGALASDPATAPSGAPSTAGDLYFNTVASVMYEYTGAVWQEIATAGLPDGSVTTAKLADAAVTLAKLAADVSLSTSSATRNQVLNQDPLSQGLSQRVGFSSTLYTGTGASQAVATGVDMSTGDLGGLVWLKSRTDSHSHYLFDTIRGSTNYLVTDANIAEGTTANYTAAPTSSTEVTLGSGANMNGIGSTYVAWSFQTTAKFTGTTNRNNPYTAHYNPELGFSVVGYIGDGGAGHEIPHHLGQEPELSIFKDRDNSLDWIVQTPMLGTGDYLYLNTTIAVANSVTVDTLFSDTTTAVGTSTSYNAFAQDYISYNFASVKDSDGLNITKVGKYIGTGAAGNYVPCNFGDKKAGFVLVKNLTTAADWIIWDASRTGDNLLYPNLSVAEGITASAGFVTGGFTVEGAAANRNALNDEYLFYAIADNTVTTGQTDYDYPTTADTLTIEQDTLISFAGGFSASGETNVQENVPAATTLVLGTGFEDKKLYVYKDEAGSYGTTEYRPLEDQDYSGVQTPNQVDKNLRTTAKHFDYESSTGVASASGEFNDNLAWRAFNKDSNNVIPGAISQWVVASITTSNLQYKLSEKRILKSWRIRGAQSSAWNPKRFTIEGSNDGFAWTAIDSTYTASDFTVSASLWSPLQDTSANTTAYLYHRINITANNGDATYTAMAELELNTETPSDRYDVSEGVMYNYAGTAINRVYLGELRTDTNGDIINESIVNYTPNKLKGTDAELHGDLIVRGEIANPQVCTAWVNFDGTQNPPLIRSSFNVKDIVDLGTGVYEVVFETPMANVGYITSGSCGFVSGSTSSNGRVVSLTQSLTTSVKVITGYIATASVKEDSANVNVTIYGGKS